MDNITGFILAIIFSIIVCTDIMTYIIKVEKLEIKTEKKTFLLSNIIKSTIYVLNNKNVSINSKNIRNTTFSISDRYGFNSI